MVPIDPNCQSWVHSFTNDALTNFALLTSVAHPCIFVRQPDVELVVASDICPACVSCQAHPRQMDSWPIKISDPTSDSSASTELLTPTKESILSRNG